MKKSHLLLLALAILISVCFSTSAFAAITISNITPHNRELVSTLDNASITVDIVVYGGSLDTSNTIVKVNDQNTSLVGMRRRADCDLRQTQK